MYIIAERHHSHQISSVIDMAVSNMLTNKLHSDCIFSLSSQRSHRHEPHSLQPAFSAGQSLYPRRRQQPRQGLQISRRRSALYQKGFRVRQVTVITTLLDAQEYPAQEILCAYLRRWRLEICLDDLKTTLRMESLRNRSPEMAQKELYTRLIAHNLIRCTMAQAATEHHVPLDRISFKGSLDAVRHFSQAMAQAKSKKKRQQLWAELLRTLAVDLVPKRPGRREPRALKRKKNRYPRLVGSRRKFRDHLKRHDRRKISRLRKLGLM